MLHRAKAAVVQSVSGEMGTWDIKEEGLVVGLSTVGQARVPPWTPVPNHLLTLLSSYDQNSYDVRSDQLYIAAHRKLVLQSRAQQ